MQHRAYLAVERAETQLAQKFFLVQIVCDAAVHKVAKLVSLFEVVNGDDVVLTAAIERLDQIGPDEAGRASDYDHFASLSFRRTIRPDSRPRCRACQPRCP